MEFNILFTGSNDQFWKLRLHEFRTYFLLLYLVRQKFRENIKIRSFIIGCVGSGDQDLNFEISTCLPYVFQATSKVSIQSQ